MNYLENACLVGLPLLIMPVFNFTDCFGVPAVTQLHLV